MAGGLMALLDDVAALAKLAAASVDDIGAAAGRASTKAAGVVVDDAAVTPRYVQGFDPSRELTVIRKIAVGSLRNKIVFILPAALLLSQFASWLLAPILMLGGTYLAFEGAEKLWEKFGPGEHHGPAEPVATDGGADHEKAMVSSAIRTDFILSAEIMVIALKEVTDEPFVSRALILALVAVAITALVYGAVGLIVKMDDIGLHLAKKTSAVAQKVGRGLVVGMPIFLTVLANIGIVAMLWVGGHILLVNADELGWHWPYEHVHHWEESAGGGAVGWLVNTACSAVIGVVVGAIVVAVMHLIPRKKTAH
jgi:predicted DNA repair protein MutK